MGPSGSGKSTFLNCAAGLEPPTSGRVLIDGQDVTDWDENDRTRLRRERIGFVFQGFHLMPYLTAEQNVGLPLRLAGRRQDRDRVRDLLDRVGLGDRGRHLPGALSGGQQQRVAIARALVDRPAVVLADEPTGALDTTTARDVLALLRDSVDALGQTVVMVTHDPVAASYADPRRLPRRRPGRGPDGPPDRRRRGRPDGPPRRPGRGGSVVMTALAWASLRHRATAFTATFVSVLLGTALIGSFATLVETATGHVSDRGPRQPPRSWAPSSAAGARLIVLFSLASTLGITVRQRGVEIGLLRTVGGTPRQARRLVRVETARGRRRRRRAAGAVARRLGGRLLFTALREGGLVASVDFEFGGGPCPSASDRARDGRSPPRGRRRSPVAGPPAVRPRSRSPTATVERPRMPWWRVAIALLLLGYGVAMAVVTITVTAHSDDPYAAMATSGSSGILVALGLATLAPVLLRWIGRAGAAGRRPRRRRRGSSRASNASPPLPPAGRRAGPGDRVHRGLRGHPDAGQHRPPLARRARRGHRDHQPAQQRGGRDDLAVRGDHGAQRLGRHGRRTAVPSSRGCGCSARPRPRSADRSSPRRRSSPESA